MLHRPPPPPSKTLLYVGGAALAAGVLTYGWMSYEYLAARDSFDAYNAHIDRLHVAKWTTAGLWSVGAIALAAGYYIYRRDRRDEAPVVGAAPIPNGGIVVIGWQR